MRRRRRRCCAGLAFGRQRDHRGGDAGNGADGGFRLRPNAFPGAGFRGIDIDREEHLAVTDRNRRQHIRVGQRNAAWRHHLGQTIKNLLLRYAHGASPNAVSVLIASEPGASFVLTRFLPANRGATKPVIGRAFARPVGSKTLSLKPDAILKALQPKRLPRSDVIGAFGRSGAALLLGRLVVQLDHDAIGVVDENLPKVTAGNLPRVVLESSRLQPLLHAAKPSADESDVMN